MDQGREGLGLEESGVDVGQNSRRVQNECSALESCKAVGPFEVLALDVCLSCLVLTLAGRSASP